jgi:SAM-dependent methyltransferase
MTGTSAESPEEIREAVRAHYAAAIAAVPAPGSTGTASCCAPAATAAPSAAADPMAADAGCRGGESFAARQYGADDRAGIAPELVEASFGCGNPFTVADLDAGEVVLDLGSGGGLDVLLSARRVGPTGRAYGIDMTDEMLERARDNAAAAGATNVEFRKGTIEEIPLADATIDVVISNCVINLSPDKAAVFAEVYRVLRPGGRFGVSDIVTDDGVTPEQRAAHGDWASCAAGALSRGEYLAGLRAAGFADAEVRFTNDFTDGMHAAVIRAVKPTGTPR